jgi:mannose-1-phosphate guanylyltransferase
MLERIKRFEQ